MSNNHSEQQMNRTLGLGQHVALCMAVAGLVSVLSLSVPGRSTGSDQPQGNLQSPNVVSTVINSGGAK